MTEKRPPSNPKPIQKDAGPVRNKTPPGRQGGHGSDPVEPPGGGGGQVKGDIVK